MRVFKAVASVGKVETLADSGNKITLYTEELKPEYMTLLFAFKNTPVHFLMSADNIEQTDIPTDEQKIETKGGKKTPSEKLRAAIWVYWEQKTDHAEDFDTQYYPRIMEQIRQRYLRELD